jgi:hypothetical protein
LYYRSLKGLNSDENDDEGDEGERRDQVVEAEKLGQALVAVGRRGRSRADVNVVAHFAEHDVQNELESIL